MKKNYLYLFFVGSALLFASPVIAQKGMTLKECVAFGLQNDLATKRSAMEMAYISAQEKEAYASIYPQVSGEVKYSNNIIIPTYYFVSWFLNCQFKN